MIEPDRFAVSWTRTYSLRVLPQELLGPGGSDPGVARRELGPLVDDLQPGDDAFFDIHAIRCRHVARVRLRGLSLDPPPGARADAEPAPVAVHLLLHATGFAVLRLTLRSDRLSGWPTADGTLLGRLEGAVGHPESGHWGDAEATPMVWRLPAAEPLAGGVRAAMDAVFLAVQGHRAGAARRWRPAAPDGDDPDPVVRAVGVAGSGIDARYEVLQALCDRGETLSAYPVVFGAHLELGWTDPDALAASTADAWTLACGRGASAAVAVPAATGEGPVTWLLGENRSVVLHTGVAFDARLDALDTDRTQLVEFLTLQRGALRWVQRESQQTITGRRGADRARLARWIRVVGALTDDYVLHDRVGGLLANAQRALEADPGIRDHRLLEGQVRSNLETFGSEHESGIERAGLMLGLLFGVVAAAALTDPVHRLMAIVVDEPSAAEFVRSYPGTSLAIDAATILLVAVLSVWVYVLASRPLAGRRRL
jgi:hypothetical protein